MWPEQDGFRANWKAYYSQMERLAARIMGCFAAALSLDETHFTPYIDAPISALRALHYPATKGAAADGQQRAGAHTYYGSLTILLPQQGYRGMQIVTTQGDWIDVTSPDGAFVI